MIHEAPIPPRGKIELSFTMGDVKFYYSRPPVNAFPFYSDVAFVSINEKSSLFYPFKAFKVADILILLELILLERKIVFVSSQLCLLRPIMEAFVSLIYPFNWHHIFIPILPARLLNYLQAPVPFLIGVSREYFDSKDSLNDLHLSDVFLFIHFDFKR